MRLYEYIKLSFDEKVELLEEEGEFIETLSSNKDAYSLYDFYVVTTTGRDEEIVYIYATKTIDRDAY